MIYVFWKVLPHRSNMMGQCAILVDNSRYMESVGNVQNVQTMIYAQFVIIRTNIIYDTDFIVLREYLQKLFVYLLIYFFKTIKGFLDVTVYFSTLGGNLKK